jgi:ADP-heptose:LPS heptosyltransferase
LVNIVKKLLIVKSYFNKNRLKSYIYPLYKEIRFYLFIVTDLLFIKSKKHKIKFQVCIIRTDAIGDFILWMPFFLNLIHIFKDEKILYIYNSAHKSIIDGFDLGKGVKCIPLEINRYVREIKYRRKFNSSLNKYSIDTLINPIRSRSGPIDDSLARVIASNHKITSATDFINASKLSSYFINTWYSKIINIDAKFLHEYDYNLSFFESLDLKFDSSISYNKFLKVDSSCPIDDNYFVVQPFSSNLKRNWPIENYVKLINYITFKFNYKAVIVGSSKDIASSNVLISKLSGDRFLNLTGKIDLSLFMEVIQHAKFAFSNDSSAAHACAYLQTQCFAMIGLGQPGRFFPYPKEYKNNSISMFVNPKYNQCSGCEWNCTIKHNNSMAFPCVQEIPLNDVLEEVKIFLSK